MFFFELLLTSLSFLQVSLLPCNVALQGLSLAPSSQHHLCPLTQHRGGPCTTAPTSRAAHTASMDPKVKKILASQKVFAIFSLTSCLMMSDPTSPSSGNYPRPPHYGGAPSANYSGPGPGPGLANSLGLNASSPMHGQGPSTPAGRGPGPGTGGRPFPAGGGAMAPTSPGMPQPAGQGMRPPGPNAGRKMPDVGPNAGPSANSSSSSTAAAQSR